MRLDTASKTLILAAHVMEYLGARQADRTAHPLEVVAQAAQLRGHGWRSRYEKAARKLLDCNGTDLLDLALDEKIDILVAAAIWEGA